MTMLENSPARLHFQNVSNLNFIVVRQIESLFLKSLCFTQLIFSEPNFIQNLDIIAYLVRKIFNQIRIWM